MKYGYLILIITVFAFPLFSQNIELTGDKNFLQITGNFEIEKISSKYISNKKYSQIKISECINTGKYGEAELPVYTKFVSLPETGNFKVINLKYEFEEIDIDKKIIPFGWQDNQNFTENYYQRNQWLPEDIVTISKPNIMRGIRFSQITITAIQYNPFLNKIRVLKDIDFEFEIDFTKTENPLKKTISSKLFYNLVEKNIYGAEPERSSEEGQYLFIVPDNYESTLQPLKRWKEKLGYKTRIATISETGSTNDEIKDYLQDAYDNWETPPEYVVLVGDVSGSIVVPAFYVPGGQFSPWDVTDHNYTLLEGDDYFPDILIGRLSVRSLFQLQTVISKIINYESNPYSEEWIKSALMIGFINHIFDLFSHRETKMAVREKLLDFEYAKVDTFIFPYQWGNTQLANMINDGHSFVNFRGCGSYNYWASELYIFFNIDDVNNLNNGFMLPMVTSMTCGTGNFAADNYPSCFGETWLNAGSPSVPKGAIAFIGPSELDTRTGWNNCYDLGIYQGITQENLFRCGEMLLRGKMELYINYPYCHEWGGPTNSDQFYFYVYNLLGDSGLAIWTDIPKEVTLIFNEQLPFGSNYTEIQIEIEETDKSNFTIAITNEDSLIAVGITDESGSVSIPCELDVGDYSVTASKYGYIPKTEELSVIEGNYLGLLNYNLLEDPISGDSINIELTLKNFGTLSAEDVTINLISEDDKIEVISSEITNNEILAGELFICNFQIQICDEWYDGFTSNMFVNISSSFGESSSIIPVEILSPELVLSDFIVDNSSNCLIQNEIGNVIIELKNCGNNESGNFNVNFISQDEKVEIINAFSSYENILVNNSGCNLNFLTVNVANVISGELADFKLEILRNSIILQEIEFDIPIGIIDEFCPTFCDYSYYAIESRDIGNFETPEYNWIEIDPDLGGEGNLINADHTTADGFIKTIDLPFQFSFFGLFYHSISICSEGFIAMGEANLIFHRNRNIPSGIGPDAMIAPFWDDIEGGELYGYFDEENHYFIIEWSEWHSVYNPEYMETFQVILYDTEYYPTPTGDGEILFQYKEIHNIDQEENFATIGIENETQTEGLLITFADIYPQTVQPLENETAILFTIKEGPDIPFLTVDPSTITISVYPDTVITKEITLFNASGENTDISYTIIFSHFSRNSGKSQGKNNRNIENDFIHYASGQFIPVMPMNLLFYLVHNSPDGEPVYGVRLNFPSGFYVNSATDIETLLYNNETGDGVEVSWGFGNGEVISPSVPVWFHVNVTIDENQTQPVEIGWYIEGDGTGSEPHSVTGTMTINPTSDTYFWISYPNGGEKLLPGIQDSVKWNHYGDVDIVKIQLSRDEGSTWEILENETNNTGFYEFMVTGPLSDECQMKVGTPDNEYFDISDSLFQITALNIQYPTSGSILSYGETDTIKWIDIGGIDKINIEYTINNEYTWETLASGIDNYGFFEFTVPGPPSEFCKIRISSLDGVVVNTSDLFTIVDSPVNWLYANTMSGTIPAGESENIILSISSENLEVGTYEAYLRIETNLGQVLSLPVCLEVILNIPAVDKYKLFQNYPNPFNPSGAGRSLFTRIRFDLKESVKVKLQIFNLKGQLIKTLLEEQFDAGEQEAWWDGTDRYNNPVSSGIYFYKLKAGDYEKAKKMILLK
ncbi:MAG: T9SS type A sorting domain-containing protein [Candidatus Cloacimonetes bacterium]|nr:T9SS type A sorting domain-containing protein [Candidatus Cloacimonadota bacterium]